MGKSFLTIFFKVQVVIATVIMVVSVSQGYWLDSLYGIFLSIFNTVLLMNSFKVSARISKINPAKGMAVLYASAVIRFVLLSILFVIGLAGLKLYPPAVVLAFVFMQIGQIYGLKGKRRLTD